MKSTPLRRSISLLLVCVSLLTWSVPSFATRPEGLVVPHPIAAAMRQENFQEGDPQHRSGLEEQLRSPQSPLPRQQSSSDFPASAAQGPKSALEENESARPNGKSEQTRLFYEQDAPEYAKRWEKDSAIERFREVFSSLLPSSHLVLDAGTGPGHNAAWFHRKGIPVIGIDYAKNMVAEASRRYPTVQFLEMDLRKLRFEPEIFDGVWDNATFHHFLDEQEIGQVLEGYHRILVERGILFIRVKRGNGFASEKDSETGQERHFKLYQEEELRRLVALHGFEIIESGVKPDAKRDIEWIYLFAKRLPKAPSKDHRAGLEESEKSPASTIDDVLAQRITSVAGPQTGQMYIGAAIAAGATGIIAGHSETRPGSLTPINDSDEEINAQVGVAIEKGMRTIILCVGEKKEATNFLMRRVRNRVLARQLEGALQGRTAEQLRGRLKVAYEPRWAIGSGRAADPKYAQASHQVIRKTVRRLFGDDLADSLPIVYGGSVTKENAKSFLEQDDVDGLLVGGASTSTAKFVPIVQAAVEIAAEKKARTGRTFYIGANHKTYDSVVEPPEVFAKALAPIDRRLVQIGIAPAYTLPSTWQNALNPSVSPDVEVSNARPDSAEIQLFPELTQSFAVGRPPPETIWRQPDFTQQMVEQVGVELADREYLGGGQGKDDLKRKELVDEVVHLGQQVQSDVATQQGVRMKHVAFETKALIAGTMEPGSVGGDLNGHESAFVSDVVDPSGGLLDRVPGAGSYAVSGPGVTSLGRFPERARALLVATWIDPRRVTKEDLRDAFRRYNVKSIEELFDPQLPADQIAQRVAEANGVSVAQLDVTLIEQGQESDVRLLTRLQRQNQGMGLHLIRGGTGQPALPAILGRTDGRISLVLRRAGITPSLFKAFMASAFSNEGSLVTFRVVSNQIRSGFDQRYRWDVQEEEEIRRFRAEDKKAGWIPSDDAEAILEGKKIFSSRQVRGTVSGSYTFLTPADQTWIPTQVAGIRAEITGRYRVETLRFQNASGTPQRLRYLWATKALRVPLRWGAALEIPGLVSSRALGEELAELRREVEQKDSTMPLEICQRLGTILRSQQTPPFFLNPEEQGKLTLLTEALTVGNDQKIAIRLVKTEEPLFRTPSGKFTTVVSHFNPNRGTLTLWLPQLFVDRYFPREDLRAVTQVVLFALLTDVIGVTEREAMLILGSYNADAHSPAPGFVAIPDAMRATQEILHEFVLQNDLKATAALSTLFGQRFRLTGAERQQLQRRHLNEEQIATVQEMSDRLAGLIQAWRAQTLSRFDQYQIVQQESVGQGIFRYGIGPTHRQELDALFGAPSHPRERYSILLQGNDPVALLREDQENFSLKVRPYPNLRLDHPTELDRYRRALLGYVHQRTVTTGHLLLLTEERGDLISLFLRDDERFYRSDPTVPGRKVRPFELGNLEGQRRILGSDEVTSSERVFQLEFKSRDSSRSSMLVEINPPDKTFGQGPTFLVLPKKTALVVGYGTIGAKVAQELRRLGFEVVVANRSLSRARAAMNHGFPLYFLTDYAIKDSSKRQEDLTKRQKEFREAGVPWMTEETLEALLQRGGVDVIVNGIDKNSRPYIDQLYKKLAPATPVILEGGDESEWANVVIEPTVHEVLGVSFAGYRTSHVFKCPSCNETFGSQLLVATGLLHDLNPVSGKILFMRRQGDPFAGKSDLAAGGPTITPGSYHAEEILEVFHALPEDKRRRVPFLISQRTGKPNFTSTATFGPQTKAHQSMSSLDLKNSDGSPVDVKEVKQALAAIGSVALIGFGEKFEPGLVLEKVMDEYGASHPYLHPVGVKPSGDQVEAIGLTPQESNVVPGNLELIMALTGVVPDEDRWRFINNLVQRVLGITERKQILENSFPDPDVRESRQAVSSSWPPLTVRERFDQIREGRRLSDPEFLDEMLRGVSEGIHERQMKGFHQRVLRGEALPIEIEQQISYLSVLMGELADQFSMGTEFVNTRGTDPGGPKAGSDYDSHDFAFGAQILVKNFLEKVKEEKGRLSEALREMESSGKPKPPTAGLEEGSLRSDEERVLEGHTGPVQSVAFDPNRPERLVSGGKDGTIRGWNLGTGVKSLARSPNSTSVPEITTVAFSPDGQFFASAGNDGTIRLWDAANGRVLGDLKGHNKEVKSVAFGGRGEHKLLASGGAEGAIQLWNYTKLEVIPTPLYDEPNSPPVNSVVFSPDGETLASAVGNDILIWDALLGERKLTLQGHTGPVTSLTFAADGKRLKLISGSRDGTIRFWNISEGRSSEKVLEVEPIVTSQEVTSIALHPQGGILAVGLSNGDVRLQDMVQGKELKTLRGHQGEIHSLAFSPDGAALASAGEDKTIHLWNLSAPSIESLEELSPRSGLEETEEQPVTPTISPRAVWYRKAPRQPLQFIFRPENAGLALLLPEEGVQVRIIVATLEQRRTLFRLRPDLAGAFVPGYEFDSVEKAVKFAREQLPEAQEVGEILNRQDRIFLRHQVETWLGQFPWKVSSLDEPILEAILEGTQV